MIIMMGYEVIWIIRQLTLARPNVNNRQSPNARRNIGGDVNITAPKWKTLYKICLRANIAATQKGG